VTPFLRTPDGIETLLPAVTVRPQEVKTVDVGEAAPQVGKTYGSIVLRYRSAFSGALYASLMLQDMGHPVSVHLDAIAADDTLQGLSREGIWWLPNDTTNDYLALTNQGSASLKLTLSIYDAQGKESRQVLALGPRQTARYSVRQLVQSAGFRGSYGGIKVVAEKHAGTLDTVHFLFDEPAAFSALLKMSDRDPAAKIEQRDFARSGVWTLRAPMLALSQPDPVLAFPEGTTLHPQLLIRNTTASPVTATLRFNWRSPSAVGKAPGPSLRLAPFETRRVDIAALQDRDALPKQANWTSVTLTTQGRPDEVVAIAASYDSTLRYGAQTPFSDQLSFRWEGGQWQYDVQHNSIITVGNGGTKATRTAFTIFYNQGKDKYELEQTLQPDEQMWIDVGRLIRERVPDKNGKALPVDLASGSYEFRDLNDPGVGSLFEGKVVYDKTFGHVTYGCAHCCGIQGVYLKYSPLGVPFQGTSPNGVLGDDQCGDTGLPLSSLFLGNWKTASSSIATVDYYAKHTGVGVGSTTSLTSGQISAAGRATCPQEVRSPQGPTNVVQVAFSSLVGIVQGQTASVTVTLTPSPSPSSVTLALSTTTGQGAAVFSSSGQQTMTINQTSTVTIKGTTTSSTANNIQLSAAADGTTLNTTSFSVIWVTISTIKTAGPLSGDDDAANEYDTSNGTTQLNGLSAAFNGVEIKGVVAPSDFTDTITIKQTKVSYAEYSDTTNGSTPVSGGSYSCGIGDYTTCAVDDPGGNRNQDFTPAPSGNVYTWDAPGTTPAAAQGTISRLRQNFADFAMYKNVVASNVFTWFNRSSALRRSDGSVTWETTYNGSGDNQAGAGSTKTTFNLN
jgi:hypothetical protein